MKLSEYQKLTPEQKALVAPGDRPKTRIYIIGAAFIVVLIVLFFVFILPGDRSNNAAGEVVTGQDAYRLAKKIVADSLSDPGSAEFVSDRTQIFKMGSDSVYVIKGVVKSTDKSGSEEISEYGIKLTYKGGDFSDKNNWVVDEVNVD